MTGKNKPITSTNMYNLSTDEEESTEDPKRESAESDRKKQNNHQLEIRKKHGECASLVTRRVLTSTEIILAAHSGSKRVLRSDLKKGVQIDPDSSDNGPLQKLKRVETEKSFPSDKTKCSFIPDASQESRPSNYGTSEHYDKEQLSTKRQNMNDCDDSMLLQEDEGEIGNRKNDEVTGSESEEEDEEEGEEADLNNEHDDDHDQNDTDDSDEDARSNTIIRKVDAKCITKLELSNSIKQVEKMFAEEIRSNLVDVPLEDLTFADFIHVGKQEDKEVVGYRNESEGKFVILSAHDEFGMCKISKNGMVKINLVDEQEAYRFALTKIVNLSSSSEYSTCEKLKHVRAAINLSAIDKKYLNRLTPKCLSQLFSIFNRNVYPYWLLKVCITKDTDLLKTIYDVFKCIESTGATFGRRLPSLLKINKKELKLRLKKFLAERVHTTHVLLKAVSRIPVSPQCLLMSKRVSANVCSEFLRVHKDAHNLVRFARNYQYHPLEKNTINFINYKYGEFCRREERKDEGCVCYLGDIFSTVAKKSASALVISREEESHASSFSTYLLLPNTLVTTENDCERKLAGITLTLIQNRKIMDKTELAKFALQHGTVLSDLFTIADLVRFVTKTCTSLDFEEQSCSLLFDELCEELKTGMWRKNISTGGDESKE